AAPQPRPGHAAGPAGAGQAEKAIVLQVAVVIGEAADGAVGAGQSPDMAQGRCAGLDPGRQLGGNGSHGPTPIARSATATTRPAPKPSRLTPMRSASKRTGVSKANPAVTTAPSGGASAKVTAPVAGSTANAAVSTPATATRAVSSTGLRIGRSTS